MSTINISLPDVLKKQAEILIKDGYYVSFSDLVRTALRNVISDNQYDLWAKQAKEEYRRGKGTVLQSPSDIKTYLDKIVRMAAKK